ncbi:hypothetical protein [Methylobacterium sp. WSM2598]|uniref:hypothetical protein n=1 Tax=Methylobacterium sp. WSM2598 TaxID=398261 RepID=UPI0012F69C30|nr:hypothetical protein [Methylobacterium sp. WSM2598]
MKEERKKLAEQILDVLLDLFPISSISKKLIKLPAGTLIGKLVHEEAISIVDIANKVCDQIYFIKDEHTDNYGSARAAAWSIEKIIRNSELDAKRLVELKLDKELILEFLLRYASSELQNASAERQAFVNRGLETLSSELASNADKPPGVNLAFMREVLRRI